MDYSSWPQDKILLIYNDQLYILWTGEVLLGVADKLPQLFLSNDNFYIVGVGLFPTLARLNAELQDSIIGWKMRLTSKKRNAYTSNGTLIVGGRYFVDYISISRFIGTGTRQTRRRRKVTARFDVMNLEMFMRNPPTEPLEQLEMAQAILSMCHSREVTFRATKGSLAAAMIKKSPEWHKGRHAAPAFINNKAREYLPGNFYSVSHKIRKILQREEPDTKLVMSLPHCYYIDQYSAHHNIVSQYPLPDPQDVRARGSYSAALKSGKMIPWCHPSSKIGQELMNGDMMGLVLANISVQHCSPVEKHLRPPFAQKVGLQYVWLWTPDFRIVRILRGVTINAFICAFVGQQSDKALREYSEWALSEIDRDKPRSRYKKSTLLAAYGMLAYKPYDKPLLRYWGGRTKSGNQVNIPYAGLVVETKIKYPKHVQPSMVNVLARGLIEAETRTRSIEYAYELYQQGYHVAQIYADGIILETEQAPFIRSGWRISHELSNVWIPRTNAFLSDELVKLPGVTRSNPEDLAWIEKYEAAKRPFISMSV